MSEPTGPDRPTDAPSEPGELLRVSTSDGKYTLVQHGSGRIDVLRYGQPWRNEVHDNALLAFACELEDVRAAAQAGTPSTDKPIDRAWADAQERIFRWCHAHTRPGQEMPLADDFKAVALAFCEMEDRLQAGTPDEYGWYNKGFEQGRAVQRTVAGTAPTDPLRKALEDIVSMLSLRVGAPAAPAPETPGRYSSYGNLVHMSYGGWEEEIATAHSEGTATAIANALNRAVPAPEPDYLDVKIYADELGALYEHRKTISDVKARDGLEKLLLLERRVNALRVSGGPAGSPAEPPPCTWEAAAEVVERHAALRIPGSRSRQHLDNAAADLRLRAAPPPSEAGGRT